MDALRAAGCVAAETEAQLLEEAATTAGRLDCERLAALTDRRLAGEPLEHVLGWASFGGRRLHVEPGIFVPRPQTELLARRAAQVLAAVGPGAVAVDLCTGSGAVAAVLATTVPRARVFAVDVDARAVAVARRNLDHPGATVLCGDLDAPLPAALAGSVDVLTACPPYVPTGHLALLPADRRAGEPRRAHDGGADGLDVVRRVVTASGRLLRAGGWLLVEIGGDQAEVVTPLCRAVGLTDVAAHADEDGDVRFLTARYTSRQRACAIE